MVSILFRKNFTKMVFYINAFGSYKRSFFVENAFDEKKKDYFLVGNRILFLGFSINSFFTKQKYGIWI